MHVVQRGNNRAAVFHQARDYHDYLALLAVAARRYHTFVHAYVLMTNHVHLLLTSERTEGVSESLRYLASRFVRRINDRYGRTGRLWESRFRSSPIDSDFYCLACYRYIELNPVRAGIVRTPSEYRWSSYAVNASARTSSLVTSHETYTSLGSTPLERAERYKALVHQALPDDAVRRIRQSLQTGAPTGSEAFGRRIEALGVRVGQRRRGRPVRQRGREL